MAYTTRQQLIDRILRFYFDGIPNDQSDITINEVDLYVNDAIATIINKQAIDEYNITGIISVPEGYITTYKLSSLLYDEVTGLYYSVLPHPPLGLSGNSGVAGVYFGSNGKQSKPVLHVKPHEVDYFSSMPMPPNAAYYWIENSTIYIYCNTDLTSNTDSLFIRMATNIQSSNSAILNVPPEAVELIFQAVINKLLPRKNIRPTNLIDGKES